MLSSMSAAFMPTLGWKVVRVLIGAVWIGVGGEKRVLLERGKNELHPLKSEEVVCFEMTEQNSEVAYKLSAFYG